MLRRISALRAELPKAGSRGWCIPPLRWALTMQMIPTLGPKVHKYGLLWAISSPRDLTFMEFLSVWHGFDSMSAGFTYEA